MTEGEVYYDGIPTSSLNLDALRSSVTIIPQVVRGCYAAEIATFLNS
jgi:ABC-type multidrug transport system fused ATPase/permease subunit